MDIFKLGDKILALLEMVFGFWNNQISLVFSMLGQSPVNFKGGGPWAIIEGIEPIFVAVGSSLVVLFFVIGFCSESVDVKEEMRFEAILRMLIRLQTFISCISLIGISHLITFLSCLKKWVFQRYRCLPKLLHVFIKYL